MIKLENAGKVYDSGTTALENVNLNFAGHGLVCVLGESGCGKTTLLNLIGGLDKPTSGRIISCGFDVAAMTEKQADAYRSSVSAFVFQRGDLLPDLTAAENVELALRIKGCGAAEAAERAAAALRRVGLYGERGKLPGGLSGGQYQRVAVARAVAGDPEVLLADEPTGALDEVSGGEVMRLMKELSRDRLVIVVTHNRALAETYADRIITLSAGRVTGDTSPLPDGGTAGPPHKAYGRPARGSAAGLALRRMRSKKARSAALSVAVCVGIIGMCLVFAFMTRMSELTGAAERALMSAYPVSIADAYDIEDLLAAGGEAAEAVGADEAYVRSLLTDAYFRVTGGADIDEEYLAYVYALDPALYDYIACDYGLDYDAHLFTAMDIGGVTMNVSGAYAKNFAQSQSDFAASVLPSLSYFSRLPDDRDYVLGGCELVFGEYPDSADELVFVLDSDGCVDDYVMAFLGYYSLSEIVSYFNGDEGVKRVWSYEELTAKEFAFFNNDVVYARGASGLFTQRTAFSRSVQPLTPAEGDGIALRVTGILRGDGLPTGLYYTGALDEYFLGQASGSAVVAALDGESKINPLTGEPMMDETWKALRRSLGGDTLPCGLEIYSSDPDSRMRITGYLEAWNAAHPDRAVGYADNAATVMSYVTAVSDGVSAAMLALALGIVAVSAVMLGAMTFSGAGARRRETGILRCLGAGRAFAAVDVLTETAACGLMGAVAGIAVSYAALAVCSLFLPVSAALLVWWQALVAAAVGVAASCAAGIPPALRSAMISPASAAKE